MAIRDFSEEHRAELLALIEEVCIEDEGWFGWFVDWWEDLTSSPELESYNGDLDAYHRDILDDLDTSEAELKAIFEAVDDADERFAKLFQDQIDELENITADAQKLSDMLDTSGGAPLIAQDTSFIANYFFENFNSLANQQAYDRLLQQRIQDLLETPEFSEEAWNALESDAERAEFMERFMTEVAGIMGVSIIRGFVMEAEDSSGYLGLFSQGRLTISIYPVLYNRDEWSIVASGIIHEVRHAYQLEAAMDYENYKSVAAGNGPTSYQTVNGYAYNPSHSSPNHLFVSETTNEVWMYEMYNPQPAPNFDDIDEYKAYIERSFEYDAWSFSGQLNQELFREIAPGIERPRDFLDSLKPAHRGSW